jgi:hypothetical protein
MSWAAVIVGGSTLIGGIVQSRSQKKASDSYGKSANSQTKAIMEMYYQTREDLEPYMKTGDKGLQKYWNMLEKGPGEFEADPGYQFRKAEGEKSIDRASSAGGSFFSGKRGKALVEYGQEFASNEYDKFMNRYYQKLDAYGNVAQLGQASAARVGAAGQTAVGQSANIQTGAAQARASSYVNQGDIWGNAITQGGAQLADYVGSSRQSGTSPWPSQSV